MGYAWGTEWTEEKVIKSIMDVVEHLGIETFPTKSEIKSFYKNDALNCKIARSGGVRYWAKRLNLQIKDCESKLGDVFETQCEIKLEDIGYNVIKMKARHPYDLAVNNHIKVDVKSGYLFHNYGNGEYYSFNLEKDSPTCDIYVIYCLNDDKTINKTYIIPSIFLFGKTQLSLGKTKSKYDKFIDKWDYFELYNNFYSNLESNPLK